jgi:hypothetical protein
LGEVRIEMDIGRFSRDFYFLLEYGSKFPMYSSYRNGRVICKLREGLFVKGIVEKESMILFKTSTTFILKYMTTYLTTKTLFFISFPIFDDRKRTTFWTLFIHKNKIERINLSIMGKTLRNNHIKMSIKP